MEVLKGVLENGTYSEEYRETCRAALCVASLKHVKLSTETAMALQGLKIKILGESRARRNRGKSPVESNPNHHQALPGTPKLCLPLSLYFPDFPSLACLNGVIGSYTEPFEKQLTESDVKASQCRLSINKCDVNNAVLPLLTEKEDCYAGIPVKVYDEQGKEYPMTFILWSSKLHVFKEGWISFCNDHSLVPLQDFVTLWAFRNIQTNCLSFVIVSRRLNVFEAIKRRRLNKN
ncbi:hypothetical protein PTKIN_Ptkin19aG0063600 [Pterospermum kingtungense]